MKSLEHPNLRHLRAAEGWLGLGDYVSANGELEMISPQLRAHPDVLRVRCDIYHAAAKWDYVATIAETLVKIAPRKTFGWIQRSFALHELKRTQEAFDLLLPAAQKFPNVAIIPYNLACYCAQLGRLHDGRQWFWKALEVGDGVKLRQMALNDPDLEPLRKEITLTPS